MLWLQMLVKCADVSNPTKSFEVATKWSENLYEEWWIQGDLEKCLKLPVNPMMDRDLCNTFLAKKGFCEGYVRPLFSSMHSLLRGPLLQMEDNLAKWEIVTKF